MNRALTNAVQNCEATIPTANTGLFAGPKETQIQAMSTNVLNITLTQAQIEAALLAFDTQGPGTICVDYVVPEIIASPCDTPQALATTPTKIIPNVIICGLPPAGTVVTTCNDPNFQYNYLRDLDTRR